MSSTYDIIKKPTATSLGSFCEPQTENTARAGRADGDEYPDLVHHHNERPKKERPEEHPEPQTEPAPASEPETPFSEWDGEEGQTPHN